MAVAKVSRLFLLNISPLRSDSCSSTAHPKGWDVFFRALLNLFLSDGPQSINFSLFTSVTVEHAVRPVLSLVYVSDTRHHIVGGRTEVKHARPATTVHSHQYIMESDRGIKCLFLMTVRLCTRQEVCCIKTHPSPHVYSASSCHSWLTPLAPQNTPITVTSYHCCVNNPSHVKGVKSPP